MPTPTTTVADTTNRVQYMAHASDAWNPSAQQLDCRGYTVSSLSLFPGGADFVCNSLWLINSSYSSIQVTNGVAHASPGVAPNDLVVGLSSAWFSRFQPQPGIQPWQKNHTTVGESDVGAFVLKTLNIDLERKLRQ